MGILLDATSLIASISTALALVFGVYTYIRNKRQDTVNEFKRLINEANIELDDLVASYQPLVAKVAQQLASGESAESKILLELVAVAIAHSEDEREALLEAHDERFRAAITFALDEEFTVITQRRALQSVNKINHLSQYSNVVYHLYWGVSKYYCQCL